MREAIFLAILVEADIYAGRKGSSPAHRFKRCLVGIMTGNHTNRCSLRRRKSDLMARVVKGRHSVNRILAIKPEFARMSRPNMTEEG